MKIFQQFIQYGLIGLLNTAIHWSVFFAAMAITGQQSSSNTLAFLLAATFSFFMNAKYTFKAEVSNLRYAASIVFMAMLSWITGHIGDRTAAHPLITLTAFSGLSLGLGFLYSKFVIFRNWKHSAGSEK